MAARFLPLLATVASAQGIIEQLSFGHKIPISSDITQVPHWSSFGSNHHVVVMSDKLILTPPVPGNTRGAVWAQSPTSSKEWTAEMEFRATGQEGATSNLQVWYTKNKDAVKTDSIYTVGQFDGLALVIDQYGGTGGKIRGFLNDGTQTYRSLTNLESLAFGHCDYAYRNLGRLSKLRISHGSGLTISIDGRECFRTDKVSLPSGYYFGISGATGDNPDSFEINKFVVSNGAVQQAPANTGRDQQSQQQQQQQQHQQSQQYAQASHGGSAQSASAGGVSQQQFNELQNKIQEISQKVLNGFSSLNEKLDHAHDQVISGMPKSSQDEIHNLLRRVEGMERTLSSIQRDIGSRDYKQQLTDLQQSLEKVKGGIADHLPDHLGHLISSSSPKTGTFVLIIVAVQIMMAGAYLIYKKRRDGMPKKYL